jgi:hypothetical protein
VFCDNMSISSQSIPSRTVSKSIPSITSTLTTSSILTFLTITSFPFPLSLNPSPQNTFSFSSISTWRYFIPARPGFVGDAGRLRFSPAPPCVILPGGGPALICELSQNGAGIEGRPRVLVLVLAVALVECEDAWRGSRGLGVGRGCGRVERVASEERDWTGEEGRSSKTAPSRSANSSSMNASESIAAVAGVVLGWKGGV